MKVTTFTHPVTSPLTEAVVHSAIRILRGFVRLFMGRMSFDVMHDLLRRIHVEEGCRRVAAENNGKVILSRVALLTGVRTQIVKDLATTDLQCTEEDLVPEAMILARWANEAHYRHPENDRPVDLLIYGTGLTFQRLVSAVAGRGVTTQTVLDRLVKNGNVSIFNEHWVRLENAHWSFIEQDEERYIEVASQSLAAHLATLRNNLEGLQSTQEKWFERRVGSVHIPVSQLADVRASIAAILSQQKETICHELRDRERKGAAEPVRHVTVGYFYSEMEEAFNTQPSTDLESNNRYE